MLFSTSDSRASQTDSSAASLDAAVPLAFLAASNLCFSARWKAGGSEPPSSPPDSLLLCCSIFHRVHEQNAQLYPCACKVLLQTLVKF
ncbi:Os05g0305150 [Oryza sativa Japonica Group]|uniref:Os05g0305150 protein n=1 Tax=Oryza sativa subsp. japonica TaxID=39947 RepID=A0A0P0WKG8_ORYSJ|nr:hypothetical protein EE612_028500 [Oryza sativa]BAS93262.1 Os05g0305150 [Oryza sativa Japonica Group]